MLINIVIPAFNAEQTISRLIFSLDKQRALASSEPKHKIAVTIVNDASTDKTGELIESLSPAHFTLYTIHNAENIGRGLSINTAANTIPSEYLLLIDADCEAKDNNYINGFLDAINKGKSLVFAGMLDPAPNFWGLYFNASQDRKSIDEPTGFSTTNVLIRRTLFIEAGGFYEEYKSYGFEDRDLLLRLIQQLPKQQEEIAYNSLSPLVHHTTESVESYCQKQYLAGKHASTVFRKRFPVEYRKMHYCKVDQNELRMFSVRLMQFSALFLPLYKRITSMVIYFGVLPLKLRIVLVRICAGLSYFNGTRNDND